MPVPPLSPARLGLSLVLFVAGLALATGCSHHDEDEGAAAADSAAPPAAVSMAKPSPPPADAGEPPRETRADQARLAVADAGRLCGGKDLPDCPMQLWMKRSASPAIQAGETSALGDAFDQMAALAPSRELAPGSYTNWVSISLDGAAASRIGDIAAAKAACRECHAQYLAKYHDELRAAPIPVPPPAARP
jgi:hypothetical protein